MSQPWGHTCALPPAHPSPLSRSLRSTEFGLCCAAASCCETVAAVVRPAFGLCCAAASCCEAVAAVVRTAFGLCCTAASCCETVAAVVRTAFGLCCTAASCCETVAAVVRTAMYTLLGVHPALRPTLCWFSGVCVHAGVSAGCV